MTLIRNFSSVCVAVLILASRAAAAGERGSAEFTGFGGAHFSAVGADQSPGPVLGGSAGYFLVKRLVAVGEVSYLARLREKTFFGIEGKGRAVEFNAGLHIQLTTGETAPYISVGGGVRHTSVSAITTPMIRGAVIVAGGGSGNNGQVALGFGVRHTIGKKWGIRPEIKFLGGGGTTIGRATIGVFYQLGQ